MNLEIFMLLLLISFFCSCSAEEIRPPAVADAFYPGNKSELASMVDKFLKNGINKNIKGEIIGIISPHAGYVYSGSVAASGFKQIENKSYDTIIILGPSHYVYLDHPSIYLSGKFNTPLGDVEIDSEIAEKIKSNYKEIEFNREAHRSEHSIEVQIPFLQRVLKNFKIVPIVLGNNIYNTDKLSSAISKSIDKKKVLVIASSDMSHFPKYEDAVKVDKKTLELIKKMDIDALYQQEANIRKSGVRNLACYLCGLMPVITLIKFAKENQVKNVDIIEYKNSGDTPYGGKNRVVGYGSVIFSK